MLTSLLCKDNKLKPKTKLFTILFVFLRHYLNKKTTWQKITLY